MDKGAAESSTFSVRAGSGNFALNLLDDQPCCGLTAQISYITTQQARAAIDIQHCEDPWPKELHRGGRESQHFFGLLPLRVDSGKYSQLGIPIQMMATQTCLSTDCPRVSVASDRKEARSRPALRSSTSRMLRGRRGTCRAV